MRAASAVYEGGVRHRRFEARSREFRQRLTLAYIDLDELPELLGGRLSRRRPGLCRFRREDYLGDARLPLADAVREAVEARVGERPRGPIRLLANLSVLGHCFNPVSFYYCMDGAGERVDAVVAEVTNTPWGERHSYVLSADDEAHTPRAASAAFSGGQVLAGSFHKALHVSPFMGMDHRYEWRMTAPAQTLSAHISSSRNGHVAFDATLSLRRRELTSKALVRLTASALGTLPSIYARAGALRLEGVPVHAHAGVAVT